MEESGPGFCEDAGQVGIIRLRWQTLTGEIDMVRDALALFVISGVLLAGSTSAGEFNKKLNIGDPAPAWRDLRGVDGKMHSLADLKGKDAVVLVFTCNSCPIAVDYENRII